LAIYVCLRLGIRHKFTFGAKLTDISGLQPRYLLHQQFFAFST